MKKLLCCLCLFSCVGCSPAAKPDNPQNSEQKSEQTADNTDNAQKMDEKSADVKNDADVNKDAELKNVGSAEQLNDDMAKNEENAAQEDTQMTKDELGYEVDSFKTASGKDVSFHCIKHGSIRIQYNGAEIQIDPVTRLGENVTDYTMFPDADFIFVTHEHQDHLDPDAIASLKKSSSVIITNPSSAAKLGFGETMVNGNKRTLAGNIEVEAVPAYNNTPDREKFHPKGRDNGFILTFENLRVYIAGDTEDIEEMASIKDIDVAFLPCNQPYTMTPKQLVHAVEMIKPKVVFPYHYGETSMDEVRELLKDSTVDLRIRNYQ